MCIYLSKGKTSLFLLKMLLIIFLKIFAGFLNAFLLKEEGISSYIDSSLTFLEKTSPTDEDFVNEFKTSLDFDAEVGVEANDINKISTDTLYRKCIIIC